MFFKTRSLIQEPSLNSHYQSAGQALVYITLMDANACVCVCVCQSSLTAPFCQKIKPAGQMLLPGDA